MTAPAYRIAWRELARADLRSIIRFIGKDNPARAKSFGQELRDQVQALKHHPERCREGRFPGTRELVAHPNYIVYYRVLTDTRTVQVLRVKHAAQQTP
jgi:addiction module RelE/StbE family toxin